MNLTDRSTLKITNKLQATQQSMLTNRSDDPRVHRWHWHHIYFTLSHICYSKIWQCVLCSHQNEGKIKKTKNFSSFLGNEDLLGSTRCRATGPSRSPRGRGPPRPSCDCRSTWKRDYLVFTKFSSITTDPTNPMVQFFNLTRTVCSKNILRRLVDLILERLKLATLEKVVDSYCTVEPIIIPA